MYSILKRLVLLSRNALRYVTDHKTSSKITNPFGGVMSIRQSVRNKRQEEKKRGKVLVPNYSKVEPFS